MKTITSIQALREELNIYRKAGKTIGLVPTMGYLHSGHQSLMLKAKEQTDIVVISIFVNPLQFGPNEDFERYPRNLEKDQKIALEAGVDIIFAPSVEEMYPRVTKTTVQVVDVTSKLCGASRPGHFEGVATVVSKLFLIVQPDKAFFGQKDAQQVAVLQQMVNDLNFNVEIVPCPIIREADGLALSSRNVYLSQEEREQAAVLHASLQLAKQEIAKGTKNKEVIKTLITNKISEMPLAKIDYAEILSYPSLEEIEILQANEQIIIALAVWFGKTRLIDNLLIEI